MENFIIIVEIYSISCFVIITIINIISYFYEKNNGNDI